MIKISLYCKEIIIYINSLNAHLIYIIYYNIYIYTLILELYILLESLFLLGNFDMIFW